MSSLLLMFCSRIFSFRACNTAHRDASNSQVVNMSSSQRRCDPRHVPSRSIPGVPWFLLAASCITELHYLSFGSYSFSPVCQTLSTWQVLKVFLNILLQYLSIQYTEFNTIAKYIFFTSKILQHFFLIPPTHSTLNHWPQSLINLCANQSAFH